jgi:uncharacterized protein (UPF0332 family)
MSKSASRITRYMKLADQALATAQTNLDSDDYRAAANRAYYAVFYAASAILLTRGIERRRHSGVIGAFREHFVRTGIIEPEFSGIYGESLVVREDADYSIELPVGLDTVESGMRQASRFVQRIHAYLTEIGLEDEG